MKRFACALIVSVVIVGLIRAERPPEFRKDADAQVTGTIKKLTPKKTKYGGDGEMTTWVADVVVSKVTKGKGIKQGSTIQVTWFAVTKEPSKPIPGASGQKFGVKAKDKAQFWLMKRDKSKVWDVIYNRDGIEKITKKPGK